VCIFYIFKEKIMFKNHEIKWHHELFPNVKIPKRCGAMYTPKAVGTLRSSPERRVGYRQGILKGEVSLYC